MGLNKTKGNMYEWITHTWNTVKGECYHDCSYCYMKRWGKLKAVRFDEIELKTDLGKDNFIFVGSSNDLFSKKIKHDWLLETLNHCKKFDNTYLFQTKNPSRFWDAMDLLPEKTVLCSTIESNRFYPEIMQNSPRPEYRAIALKSIKGVDIYITIEPILDFDLVEFVEILKKTNAKQINIGADSGGHKLQEPSKEKLLQLISELEKFTKVKQKSNLGRLLK